METRVEFAARTGEYRLGAFTAIADYLTTVNYGVCPDWRGWLPLETYPDTEIGPPEGSLYFDVNGIPVSVACDHSLYAWKDDGFDYDWPGSIAVVRKHGKPISRQEFDSLRQARAE